MTTKSAARSRATRASSTSKVDDVIALLERKGTKQMRASLANYGIHVKQAFGISVGTLRQIAKSLGPDHDLALELWRTQWYEARMLATFIGEPARLTAAQMDAWCRDFDNWGIVDTACFALFDRSAHAWKKAAQWASRRPEFEKRAGFALLWSLTVHDKEADDERFIDGLRLIEREATDERHFVKKAINMALRAIGKRNRALNAAAVGVARRLSEASDANARWVGTDALRELTSVSVKSRVAKKG